MYVSQLGGLQQTRTRFHGKQSWTLSEHPMRFIRRCAGRQQERAAPAQELRRSQCGSRIQDNGGGGSGDENSSENGNGGEAETRAVQSTAVQWPLISSRVRPCWHSAFQRAEWCCWHQLQRPSTGAAGVLSPFSSTRSWRLHKNSQHRYQQQQQRPGVLPTLLLYCWFVFVRRYSSLGWNTSLK